MYDRNNLPDSSEARDIYKNSRLNDKKALAKWAVLGGLILLMLTLSLVGVFSSCSNTAISYKSEVKQLYKRSLDEKDITLTKRELKLNKNWDIAQKPVKKQIEKGVKNYINGDIKYDQAVNMLNAFAKLSKAEELCNEKINIVSNIEKGRTAYINAKNLKIQGKNALSLEQYSLVDKNDTVYYNVAQKKAKEILNKNKTDVSYEINGYLACYKIEDAKKYVNSLIDFVGTTEFLNEELTRIEKYEEFQTDLVLYKGEVEHVFTHCLIAFPELCYSSPSMTASLDEDCITPHEFIKIFESLYEKGYILIDINILAEENEDGSVKIADLYIPKGKKPLVFSIDDVTYDSRKMHTGMVDKLIVDEYGMVCTYTLQDGKEIISYTNEIFPLLSDFVRKHPDFTFRGARGTLCHTGFDGVFGYRTQSTPLDGENVNRDEEIQGALKVAAALKNEGWTFASHSYGHSQMAQQTVEYIKKDTDAWINEVTAIVGETKVMVWPYGNHIRKGEAHDYLYNSGFRIFCGVGVPPFLAYEPDGKSIYMDRKSLDGYALRNRRDKYMYLFDTEEVWDPVRPKVESWK